MSTIYHQSIIAADRHRTEGQEPVFFDAVMTPNRSLSRQHFRWLMAALVALWTIVGLAFLSAGAWPIFGFFGLDVLILYWAFKANYRSGRMQERLVLTPSALEIVETRPGGYERRWSFQPYWLQVSMDDPPEHHSKLMLRSHGNAVSVGEFLTPGERLEVAHALRNALHRLRTAPHLPSDASAGR